MFIFIFLFFFSNIKGRVKIMLIVLLTEWRIKHRCITLENIKFVNYEKIKTITGIALMAIFGFTSCQSEVDDVQGENPNTNAANSTTANNLKRT
jgi:hypothetical protein